MPGKRVMYNVPRHILAAGKNSGFLLPSKPAFGISAQPERQHMVLPKVAQRLSAKVEKNVPVQKNGVRGTKTASSAANIRCEREAA